MLGPKILITRIGSSMSDTYSESLCIERLDLKNYRLFLGGYECLGELSDFVDDETGEENIPEMISGERVQESDGQYIYGGDIIQNEDDGEIIFQSINDTDLSNWLKSVNWHDDEAFQEIAMETKFTFTKLITWLAFKVLAKIKL